MPTIDDLIEYLGIDYPDDLIKRNIARALSSAAQLVRGSIGQDVETLLPDDPRVHELACIYAADLYNRRELDSAKTSNAVRRLVQTMELQLQTEIRRKRQEVAGA